MSFLFVCILSSVNMSAFSHLLHKSPFGMRNVLLVRNLKILFWEVLIKSTIDILAGDFLRWPRRSHSSLLGSDALVSSASQDLWLVSLLYPSQSLLCASVTLWLDHFYKRLIIFFFLQAGAGHIELK